MLLLFGFAAAAVSAQAAGAALSAIARSHFQLGGQYLQSGLNTRALEEFRRASDADASFLDAHIQTANLFVTLNRPAEAIPYYRKAIGLAARRADLHFALAAAARLAGDHAVAGQFYSSGLALEPNHLAAILGLAQLQIQTGAHAEAQRTLAVAPALANDPGVIALRAYVAHRLGRLDEAATLYQRAIERNPENGDLRLNLGIVEAARGNLAAAAEHFRRAALLVRDKALVYRHLGVVLHDLGRHAEAVESLRRAVGENPADMIARFRLADAFLKISRPAEAIQQLEAIRQAAGNVPELHKPFGLAHLGMGRTVRAREELERAHALQPADTEILLALAEVYQKLGETRSAIELNRRLLTMGVVSPQIHRNLADLHAQIGESTRALEHERLHRELDARQDLAVTVAAERRLWESRFAELAANADRRVAEERAAADARVREIEARSAQTAAASRLEADSRARAIEELARRQIEELRRAQAAAPAELERLRAEHEARLASETARLAREHEARLAGEIARLTREREARPPAPAIRRDTPPAAIGPSEAERAAARAELEALQAQVTRLAAALEASRNDLATDTMRRRLLELSSELERERALREEALAAAERIRAQAELQMRDARSMVAELAAEVDRGLLEINLDTGPRVGIKVVDRLKHYVQHVRLTGDARVARGQLQAEARLADIRTRSESEVARIMREAKAEVDRARLQAAEEIRRSQIAADSRAVQTITQERERLAAEALARRMSLAEQLRAQIEADAQVRYLEEKSRIEATYEADRIRMQRDYDEQLRKFEAEFQRRLEAAQLEVKRTREQMEALTSNDTALLMRSEVYQRVVRENALLREDLAGARRRLETLGREREEMVREADGLRREFANVQARLGALEAEVRRYQGIAVLAEPLQRGINLNSATVEELQVLPGVGVQEARNIVWYRENVGPFRGVEELSKVPGIDAARAQVIRGLIRVR